jgi:peptidoglycan hydrolase CwlO-like protein
MARRQVPYARAGRKYVLAAALTSFCVAGAAFVVLPGLATSAGSPATPGPSSSVALARQRVRDVEQQLIDVQMAASQSANAYATASSQVAVLNDSIRVNQAQLVLAKAELASAQTALARRIVGLYTNPPPSLMQVLVSSGSISSALDSYDLMQHIADEDNALVKGFMGDHQRLQALSTTLRKDEASAIANRDEVAQRLSQLRTLAGERSVLLASATASLSHAEASAAQLAALHAEQARAAAAARARASASQVVGATAPANGGGSSGSGSDVSTVGSQPGGGAGSGSGSVSGGLTAILMKIAQCESGGNPHAISPGGQYRGMFQFTFATWAAVGGHGDPAQASAAEQIQRAAILYERAGPGQWPVCGA